MIDPIAFQSPPGIDFQRLLDYPVRFFPDKIALMDVSESVTFAAADRIASSLAAAFQDAGTAPSDRVAIILPNGIPFVIAEMAVIKSGMVKVPLNIRFHPKEFLFALADCEPAILVCEAAVLNDIKEEVAAIGSLKAVFSVGGPVEGARSYEDAIKGERPFRSVGYERDAAFVIRYTGGTTGRAKGIVHTVESFLALSLDVIREYGFTSKDIALHLGHLSHGNNFKWAALYAVGATQILREKFEPKQVLEDIERHHVTFVYMVPTMIHRMLREDDGKADVSSLRIFLYASAPMPVPLLRQAMTRYGQIFMHVYTLSEAPVITTILRPEEHVERDTSAGSRLASCGREVLTMNLRLLDEHGNEVAAGQVGEIAVRSLNNMATYWRRPEETARTLVHGWVMTGDMACRDEEGYLYLADRKKDLIITGALNVYPKEVEDVLHDHAAVAHAAVIGIPDNEWGEIIRAYVVLRPGGKASVEELIEHCRGNLASYKKPRQIVFVEALPLSPIGKVSRATLRQEARAEQQLGHSVAS
ncbi:class I adenylate-forming enzyme family protein [Mesorhizobium sp. CO1-1-8]|uniref:class I adenylate-forming enzyme family protein n=1 Tax=Mesorhizobium sp. CO1-1-8 TaxID=2876631 RepID=UPI001CD159FF|nr:AMP-binding protein [Mesorhizobium sp. CO1-1-8]MBZ9772382.1 AMP-binding protein [Mesorhizobium sp. CO1-1-8]